jgi:hypothetical protein
VDVCPSASVATNVIVFTPGVSGTMSWKKPSLVSARRNSHVSLTPWMESGPGRFSRAHMLRESRQVRRRPGAR